MSLTRAVMLRLPRRATSQRYEGYPLPSKCRLRLVGLPSAAGDESHDDVGSVAVEVLPPAVVDRRSPWVGVTSSNLDIAEGDASVEAAIMGARFAHPEPVQAEQRREGGVIPVVVLGGEEEHPEVRAVQPSHIRRMHLRSAHVLRRVRRDSPSMCANR